MQKVEAMINANKIINKIVLNIILLTTLVSFTQSYSVTDTIVSSAENINCKICNTCIYAPFFLIKLGASVLLLKKATTFLGESVDHLVFQEHEKDAQGKVIKSWQRNATVKAVGAIVCYKLTRCFWSSDK